MIGRLVRLGGSEVRDAVATNRQSASAASRYGAALSEPSEAVEPGPAPTEAETPLPNDAYRFAVE